MELLRRFSSLLLIPLLCAQTILLAAAPVPDEAVIRLKVSSYGIGHRVRVDLADKTRVKGIILSIDDKSFAVKPKGNAPPQTIPYSSVLRIHKDGLSTGQKIGIAAGVVFVSFGILSFIALEQFRHAKF